MSAPPAVDQPAVSLVMVTWNAITWTRGAIDALMTNTDLPHELIVVDNGSTDGTRDFLRSLDATVLLNERNVGFGVAANLGAARARAPVIVFVNSDTLVGPGWIAPLRQRIVGDPRVGAAGPRILDLERRIDHAGALTAHDGWTMHYGAGADPGGTEYAFPRLVDYLSGACLAVRARAFHAAGGFDPLFETAYFEDADLCLRLTAAGWNVVYDPASTVVHAGGASGTPQSRLRLLATNHSRFQQRWRDLLATRPAAPLTARSERTIAARDAPARGTILIVGDRSGIAGELADRLIARVPGVCITLVGEPDLDVPHVEHVAVLTDQWLQARRFHYDLVASASSRRAALRATQPQAIHVDLKELLGSMPSILTAAGIA